jgi:hypothetical protein
MASTEVKKIGILVPIIWIVIWLVVILGILNIVVRAFGDTSSSAGLSIDWLSWIGFAGIAFGAFLLYQKNDAAKWLILLSLCVIFISSIVNWLGPENLNLTGERLGAQLATSNSAATPASARDLLCGPEQFIETRVNSSTTSVRLEARLLCPVFAPSKNLSASLRIRFNGGEWQDWIGNTQAPKFQGTIRHMDVLGTGIVRVHFGL